ncbi:4-alpha-glucanotransferase [uncultured Alistipes sp.]|uniref:4-alpha-glucanotransferase n=1 Tax=uncultured Alistipes sp. TaxID=538949 RepID=UPI0032B29B5F
MIPHCVPQVMNDLQILSLEVQRMPKDPNSEFGNTWGYPYRSVSTTSTHDMSPLRAWWEEDRVTTQRFYNAVLHEPGEAPLYCEPWVAGRIVDLHLASPSMLVILPMQDWLAEDGELRREVPQEERINVPSIPRYYWRYRMHLTLEQLLGEQDFNTRMRTRIEASGR